MSSNAAGLPSHNTICGIESTSTRCKYSSSHKGYIDRSRGGKWHRSAQGEGLALSEHRKYFMRDVQRYSNHGVQGQSTLRRLVQADKDAELAVLCSERDVAAASRQAAETACAEAAAAAQVATFLVDQVVPCSRG